MKVPELKAKLEELGVEYPEDALKAELEELLEKAQPSVEAPEGVPANEYVAEAMENGLKPGEAFKMINGRVHVEVSRDGVTYLVDPNVPRTLL